MENPSLFAGIDIGSNTVKIKIVQYQADALHTLEDFSTDLAMGDEVFRDALISEATIKRLIEIVSYYQQLIQQYQVTHYRAVATSSLRAADNSKFVIDAIDRHTGLEVEVIDDSVEKFLTYKSIPDRMEEYQQLREEGTVIIELTSGGCDVSFYRDQQMLRNDEIGVGSQHLRQMLNRFIEDSPNYIAVLEEYIATKIDYVSKLLKKRQIKNVMIVGGDIRAIAQRFFDNQRQMSRREFQAFYEHMKNERETLIDQSMKIGKDWHEVLASMVLFAVFLDTINCRQVLIPDISLRDGIISDLISQAYPELKRYQAFDQDPFRASFQIAKRFGIHSAHAKYVHRVGTQLFDILAPNYRLDASARAVLRHSAHLHEIGKSLDLNNYYETSALMVQGMRLFGVPLAQLQRIARVCDIMGQLHEVDTQIYNAELQELQIGAILALADALDASKQQKMRITELKLKRNSLVIYYQTKSAVTIEETILEELRPSIRRIFGLKLALEEV